MALLARGEVPPADRGELRGGPLRVEATPPPPPPPPPGGVPRVSVRARARAPGLPPVSLWVANHRRPERERVCPLGRGQAGRGGDSGKGSGGERRWEQAARLLSSGQRSRRVAVSSLSATLLLLLLLLCTHCLAAVFCAPKSRISVRASRRTS